MCSLFFYVSLHLSSWFLSVPSLFSPPSVLHLIWFLEFLPLTCLPAFSSSFPSLTPVVVPTSSLLFHCFLFIPHSLFVSLHFSLILPSLCSYCPSLLPSIFPIFLRPPPSVLHPSFLNKSVWIHPFHQGISRWENRIVASHIHTYKMQIIYNIYAL